MSSKWRILTILQNQGYSERKDDKRHDKVIEENIPRKAGNSLACFCKVSKGRGASLSCQWNICRQSLVESCVQGSKQEEKTSHDSRIRSRESSWVERRKEKNVSRRIHRPTVWLNGVPDEKERESGRNNPDKRRPLFGKWRFCRMHYER